ncbi:LacI family transcriptional regulator [Labrys miyagiensis]|uniref:LacI family transcriptional regulator n=1 Tax=Labrys miyagiensis TaxID=346912 RepID=A0ABQ6CMQ0_9HYPH|nr:LacI family DNA-binding transcriptional regulator [Labrys miyagiensis]GLS21019.1 LacI family transcriptional regulator [Labrys miyagiensis]
MGPIETTNLRKIATSLGLSVTTVSRALKDGPEVHPQTIARVKARAAEAGYAPNLHGRALRTGRTRMIVVILPLETRAYLADIAKVPLIEGMTLAAQERGYTLSIYSTTPDEDRLQSLNRLIQSGNCDGVIVTRMTAGDARIAFMRQHNVPFVAFGRSDVAIDYAYVDIDNEGMAREATRRLIAEGHRRIALQLLSRDDQSSAMRLRGYFSSLADADLTQDPSLVGYDDFTMAASEKFFERMLDLPMPPTGLICANELGLLGAISALRKRNLLPGRDVGLVSRDSTGMCKYLALPVLTHFVDMSEVGRLLVDALLRQINDPGAERSHIVLKGQFERYD